MTTANTIVDFQAKQGEPLIVTATLLSADGSPANLTGLTVKFNMRPRGKAVPLIARGACTIVAPLLGTVQYSGVAADTATTGPVEAEFLTLNGTTLVQYFPDAKDTYLLGYITPAIA